MDRIVIILKTVNLSFRLVQQRVCDLTLRYEKPITTIALFAWLLIVVTVALNHEMWRDEVRALSMALDADNFWDLFSVLRNEGHPFLWYCLLKAAYWVWPTTTVLQIVSILVGFGAVVFFLRKSSFPLIVRLLFIFGMLPLVLYSVSARNYGISMLFLFLFADTYAKPDGNNYLIAIYIALLANTNYLAMMFSGFLVVLWTLEAFINADDFRSFIKRYSLPMALAVSGIALAFFTIMMDSNSSQAPPELIFSRNYFDYAIDAIVHPGLFFSEVIAATPFMRDVIIFALLAGLLAAPLYAVILYFSIITYNLFSLTILGPSARHQGIALMLIIAFYWIRWVRKKNRSKQDYLLLIMTYLVLVPLFYQQVILAKGLISEEFKTETSASSVLGGYIRSNYQLHDAVIIGDPDYLLGTLAYYTSNRIFYVRENRYDTYERYVKVQKEYMTLQDMLESAKQIRKNENVPVLIVLQHWEIPQHTSYVAHRAYGRHFRTNREEVARFAEQTIKLAEFNFVASDENYEVFLLPKTTKQEYFRKYGDYLQRLDQ